MENSKYKLAGWFAIAQAVIFPVAIVYSLIEQSLAARFLDMHRPIVGPSDFLMIIFTAIAVYTFLMFRKLLNEHYQYHGLDLLIIISVWWMIMFQVIGLGLGIMAMIYWPVDKIIMAVIFMGFFTASMVTVGIIDILIAIKIFQIKDQVSEYIKIFGYISMVAGICEVSVILSPLTLLLVPVLGIILALIFWQKKPEVEFV